MKRGCDVSRGRTVECATTVARVISGTTFTLPENHHFSLLCGSISAIRCPHQFFLDYRQLPTFTTMATSTDQETIPDTTMEEATPQEQVEGPKPTYKSFKYVLLRNLRKYPARP
jgi:hypothetical protein